MSMARVLVQVRVATMSLVTRIALQDPFFTIQFMLLLLLRLAANRQTGLALWAIRTSSTNRHSNPSQTEHHFLSPAINIPLPSLMEVAQLPLNQVAPVLSTRDLYLLEW